MKTIRSLLTSLLFLVLVSLLVVFVLNTVLNQPEKEEQAKETPQKVELVAIGDSLTEGVGDSLGSGGYVPRVAELMEETKPVSEVITHSFGVSGKRSDQILSRMETDPEIEAAVKEADMVVFTVGGNDIIKTFKNELLNVQLESFKEPLNMYEQNIEKMIEMVQQWKPDTEIYLFGVYNPYALYFSEIEEMQVILDEWNKKTSSIAQQYDNTHYVPIDEAFVVESNLTDVKAAQSSPENTQVIENPYLYEDDLFHPNDAGYSKMAGILFNEMKKYEDLLD